jgi:hypothetical protein
VTKSSFCPDDYLYGCAWSVATVSLAASIHPPGRTAHHPNGLDQLFSISGFGALLFGAFDKFGGVGAGEEVDGPVGEDVHAV